MRAKTQYYFDKLSNQEHYTPLEDNFFDYFWIVFYCRRIILESISKLVSNMKGHLILDLGCGDGIFSCSAASIREDIHLVCADLSLQSLKKAKQRITLSSGVKCKVSYVRCDAEKLPFKAESFDAIMTNNLLHHLPNLKSLSASLDFVYKVLKKGKHALICDLTSDNLLINFARKIFPLMPQYVKKNIKDPIILQKQEIPTVLSFKANTLKDYLKTVRFMLIEDRRDFLFIFIFKYICEVIKPLRGFSPLPLLLLLYKIERNLMKYPFFKNFGRGIILFVKKVQ